MGLGEAYDIAKSCECDLHPPTNPIVLLNSALTIYKEHGNNDSFKRIIDWLHTSAEVDTL